MPPPDEPPKSPRERPPWDDAAGESDVGRRRNHNEDGLLIREDLGLFVVLDSSGGCGQMTGFILESMEKSYTQAARLAAASWPPRSHTQGADDTLLRSAIKLANLRAFERGQQEPALRGACSALVAAQRCDEGVLVAHVGDCRAYRLRAGALERLTEDHSLLNEFMRTRHLSPAEIAEFPHKNVIIRSAGAQESLAVDCQRVFLQPGDVLCLCSDGLHGQVSEGEMVDITQGSTDLRRATRRLIERANENGGPDNITALLVRWR